MADILGMFLSYAGAGISIYAVSELVRLGMAMVSFSGSEGDGDDPNKPKKDKKHKVTITSINPVSLEEESSEVKMDIKGKNFFKEIKFEFQRQTNGISSNSIIQIGDMRNFSKNSINYSINLNGEKQGTFRLVALQDYEGSTNEVGYLDDALTITKKGIKGKNAIIEEIIPFEIDKTQRVEIKGKNLVKGVIPVVLDTRHIKFNPETILYPTEESMSAELIVERGAIKNKYSVIPNFEGQNIEPGIKKDAFEYIRGGSNSEVEITEVTSDPITLEEATIGRQRVSISNIKKFTLKGNNFELLKDEKLIIRIHRLGNEKGEEITLNEYYNIKINTNEIIVKNPFKAINIDPETQYYVELYTINESNETTPKGRTLWSPNIIGENEDQELMNLIRLFKNAEERIEKMPTLENWITKLLNPKNHLTEKIEEHKFEVWMGNKVNNENLETFIKLIATIGGKVFEPQFKINELFPNDQQFNAIQTKYSEILNKLRHEYNSTNYMIMLKGWIEFYQLISQLYNRRIPPETDELKRYLDLLKELITECKNHNNHTTIIQMSSNWNTLEINLKGVRDVMTKIIVHLNGLESIGDQVWIDFNSIKYNEEIGRILLEFLNKDFLESIDSFNEQKLIEIRKLLSEIINLGNFKTIEQLETSEYNIKSTIMKIFKLIQSLKKKEEEGGKIKQNITNVIQIINPKIILINNINLDDLNFNEYYDLMVDLFQNLEINEIIKLLNEIKIQLNDNNDEDLRKILWSFHESLIRPLNRIRIIFEANTLSDKDDIRIFKFIQIYLHEISGDSSKFTVIFLIGLLEKVKKNLQFKKKRGHAIIQIRVDNSDKKTQSSDSINISNKGSDIEIRNASKNGSISYLLLYTKNLIIKRVRGSGVHKGEHGFLGSTTKFVKFNIKLKEGESEGQIRVFTKTGSGSIPASQEHSKEHNIYQNRIHTYIAKIKSIKK